jgi:hypothetical protein
MKYYVYVHLLVKEQESLTDLIDRAQKEFQAAQGVMFTYKGINIVMHDTTTADDVTKYYIMALEARKVFQND